MKLKDFIKLSEDPYVWCQVHDSNFEMRVFYNSISNIPDELLERTLTSWEVKETQLGPEMIFTVK